MLPAVLYVRMWSRKRHMAVGGRFNPVPQTNTGSLLHIYTDCVSRLQKILEVTSEAAMILLICHNASI